MSLLKVRAQLLTSMAPRDFFTRMAMVTRCLVFNPPRQKKNGFTWLFERQKERSFHISIISKQLKPRVLSWLLTRPLSTYR